MQFEVEQKFFVPDSPAFVDRLGRLGVTLGPPIEQRDHYFNHPSRDFAQTDEAFRLRLSGAKSFIRNAAVPVAQSTNTGEEDAWYAVATDYTAYVMSAYRAAQHMKDNGDLILVGSMSAHSLGGGSSIYAGMKKGIQGFAEALHKELGKKGIKVGLVEPGLTGADFQYPDIPADKQREMINAEQMLRAEDIAVAVHFMLTQPRRAVVQQLAVTQRVPDE